MRERVHVTIDKPIEVKEASVDENHRADMKREIAEMIVELLDQAESKGYPSIALTNYRKLDQTICMSSLDGQLYEATLNPNDTWDTLTGVFVALSKRTGRKLPDWIYDEKKMRKIKFRGKTLDGRWIYGDLWHRPYAKDCVTIVSFMEDTGTTECLEVISGTVGQYTGLKDKNGKEIYEGDIVAFEDSDGGYEYPDLAVNTGVVEYGELRFYFTNRVAVEMDDFYIKDGRCDEIEVLGNIHDNTELMEEAEEE